MRTNTEKSKASLSSPISLLEDLFYEYGWSFEREGEVEIEAELEGIWCNFNIYALWRHDTDSLMISNVMDIKIPQDKLNSVIQLLGLFNPRLWLGHFEIVPDEDVIAFRYNLLLKGNSGASDEQLEEILSSSIMECDRLYPALQFLLWGGKTPEEALLAAMLDTQGEA